MFILQNKNLFNIFKSNKKNTMSIEKITRKFQDKNYRITRCISGEIVVTDPRGFGKSFNSYAAAHRYYF